MNRRIDCPGCGAVLTAENSGQMVCPYCDRVLTVPAETIAAHRPDEKLPGITKKKAVRVTVFSMVLTLLIVAVTIFVTFYKVRSDNSRRESRAAVCSYCEKTL